MHWGEVQESLPFALGLSAQSIETGEKAMILNLQIEEAINQEDGMATDESRGGGKKKATIAGSLGFNS